MGTKRLICFWLAVVLVVGVIPSVRVEADARDEKVFMVKQSLLSDANHVRDSLLAIDLDTSIYDELSSFAVYTSIMLIYHNDPLNVFGTADKATINNLTADYAGALADYEYRRREQTGAPELWDYGEAVDAGALNAIAAKILGFVRDGLKSLEDAAPQDDAEKARYYTNVGILIGNYTKIRDAMNQVAVTYTSYRNDLNALSGNSGAVQLPSYFWLGQEAAQCAEEMEQINRRLSRYANNSGQSGRDDSVDVVGVVDLEGSLLANLANVIQGENGIGADPAKEEILTNLFRAIMAAGSVYVPLSSKVGNDAFMSALKSLVKDEQQKEPAVKVYETLKGYKKPLYLRNMRGWGLVAMEGKICTIADFIDAIDTGKPFALSSCKGQFMSYSMSGSWCYVATKETIPDGSSLVPLGEDGILNDVSLAVSGIIADETITNNNFFNQPILYSAGDSMLNQRFNMTYALLTNILKNSKEISRLGNLNMQFLYVNVFGDIVTADDTVIFPAAANPAYYVYGQGINVYMPFTATFMNNCPLPLSTYSYTDSGNWHLTEALQFSGNGNVGKYVFGGLTILSEADKNLEWPENFESLTAEEQMKYVVGYSVSDEDLQEAHQLLIDNNAFGIGNTVQNTEVEGEDTGSPVAVAYHHYYKSYGDLENRVAIYPRGYRIEDADSSAVVAALGHGDAKIDLENYLDLPLILLPYVSEEDATTDQGLILRTYDVGEKEPEVSWTNRLGSIIFTSVVTAVVGVVALVTAPIGGAALGAATAVTLSTKGAMFIAGASVGALSWNIGGVMDNSDYEAAKNLHKWTALVTTGKQRVLDGTSVFPYSEKQDSFTGYAMAEDIARNAYAYLSDTNTGTRPADRFIYGAQDYCPLQLNEAYVLNNVLIGGIGGTNDVNSFVKQTGLTYETFVAEAPNRFYSFLQSICTKMINGLDKTRGLMGLGDITSNSILAGIFAFLKNNITIILLVVAIVLVLGFLRQGLMISTLVFRLAVTISSLWLLLFVLPEYVPIVYNAIINDFGNDMFYKILVTQQESSMGTEEIGQTQGSEGFVNRTASITLYHFSRDNMEKVKQSFGITSNTLDKGGVLIVDKNAGTYIEGNKLKVTTDTLFSSTKPVGSFMETSAGKIYQMRFVKTASNNLDYYMPYYLILNSFTSKVNLLCRIYNVPRSTQYYPTTDDVMDCYLYRAYINSLPFLLPTEYLDMLTVGDGRTQAEENELLALKELLGRSFGSNQDWLGITDFLLEPAEAAKSTIWMQTMKRRGFYGENWEPDLDKLANLIEAVNLQTKDFVLDNASWADNLCDDTLLKAVSLYATTVFNAKISDMGLMVYPTAINYEDYAIDNVLVATLISEEEAQKLSSTDLTSSVIQNHGWLALLVLDLDLLLLFVITYVIKLLVPTIYLALIGIVIVNVFIGKSSYKVVKGFLKVNALTIGAMTFIDAAIVLIAKLDGRLVGIFALLLCSLLTFYVLLSVIGAVLNRFTELGDSSINVKAASIAGKTHLTEFATNARQVFRKDAEDVSDEGYGSNGMGFGDYKTAKSVSELYGGYKKEMEEEPELEQMKEEKLTQADYMRVSSSLQGKVEEG